MRWRKEERGWRKEEREREVRTHVEAGSKRWRTLEVATEDACLDKYIHKEFARHGDSQGDGVLGL